MINIKRESGSGNRIIWGSVIGITAGGIIGAASYTSSDFLDLGVGANILVGSLIGGISGAVFGALIGSKNHKYLINKKQVNFERMKNHLTRY